MTHADKQTKQLEMFYLEEEQSQDEKKRRNIKDLYLKNKIMIHGVSVFKNKIEHYK